MARHPSAQFDQKYEKPKIFEFVWQKGDNFCHGLDKRDLILRKDLVKVILKYQSFHGLPNSI